MAFVHLKSIFARFNGCFAEPGSDNCFSGARAALEPYTERLREMFYYYLHEVISSTKRLTLPSFARRFLLEGTPFRRAVLGFILTLLLVWIVSRLVSWLLEDKRDFSKFHVAITGGSSGIGLATARALAALPKPPRRITVIARNRGNLEIAASSIGGRLTATPVALDVTDPLACKTAATHALQDVDILINSAGSSIPGTLESLSVSEIESTFRLNVLGSMYLTRELIPGMKKRGKGWVVFVSSQAGQVGLYGFSAYSASKFALRGLAEALRMEISSFGIGVSILFPADTDTPCLAKENERKPEITKKLSESGGIFTPEQVAEKLINGIAHRKFLIPVSIDGWFLSTLTLGLTRSGAGPVGTIMEICSLPLLRIVAIFYSFYFDWVVSRSIGSRVNKSTRSNEWVKAHTDTH